MFLLIWIFGVCVICGIFKYPLVFFSVIVLLSRIAAVFCLVFSVFGILKFWESETMVFGKFWNLVILDFFVWTYSSPRCTTIRFLVIRHTLGRANFSIAVLGDRGEEKETPIFYLGSNTKNTKDILIKILQEYI